MKSSQEDVWRHAAKEEFVSLLNKYNWFTPIETKLLPTNSEILSSRFVFKTKHDQNWNVTKYKGCLVALGFTQRSSIDFNQTFASVAKFTSIRTLVALSAAFEYYIH